jgi:carboxylesterase type B
LACSDSFQLAILSLPVCVFSIFNIQKFIGNIGLWDQKRALEWVHENIREFGGNPKQITLWGQNAGSASVGALSVSPQTRDLFHQSIEMSGSMLAGWATSNRVVDESMQVAKNVGCALKV